MIAPYQQELTYDLGASIRYSGNENEMVITWDGMAEKLSGHNQKFQAILQKDGNIRFQYELLTGGTWSNAGISLLDVSGNDVHADLIFPTTEWTPGTVDLLTNSTFVVTNSTGDFDEGYYTNSVVTNFHYGLLEVGGTNTHKIYGDASSLTPGGTKSVVVSNEFAIDYRYGTETVPVDFEAIDSTDTRYLPIMAADRDGDGRTDVEEATFGSDGVVEVVQKSDGSRTLSWVDPGDSIDRNFVVQYTMDLTAGWTTIEPPLGNKTTFLDDDPIRNAAPVIYYRVGVLTQ